MPNPYVVKVDRNAFWNQWRSTPEPALMQQRPPEIVEASLYQDRWPSNGPYQGTSFYPFAYSSEPMEPTPIQRPLSVDLPTAPSDVDIQGLGQGFYTGFVQPSTIGWTVILGSAALSGYHGYKRNNGSWGWAAAWGLGGYILPVIVPVAALVQGFAEPTGPRRNRRLDPSEMIKEPEPRSVRRNIRVRRRDQG